MESEIDSSYDYDWYQRHGSPISVISSISLKHFFAQICGIVRLFSFLYKSNIGSDCSDSLSKSEFNYGVDGYLFEPTRSDDDTMLMACYAHRTLHDATRQDNPRQENRVMCGGLRHDATRQDKNRALSQISSIVRSLTTRPDFCLVVSRRVVDPRTLHDFLVGGCRVVSCRVVSCNVRWALCPPHTTRRDTTRQPPTRKSCNVRGSTTRRDTTRQKSGLVADI